MTDLEHARSCTRPRLTADLRTVNGRPYLLRRCPECGAQRLDREETAE